MHVFSNLIDEFAGALPSLAMPQSQLSLVQNCLIRMFAVQVNEYDTWPSRKYDKWTSEYRISIVWLARSKIFGGCILGKEFCPLARTFGSFFSKCDKYCFGWYLINIMNLNYVFWIWYKMNNFIIPVCSSPFVATCNFCFLKQDWLGLCLPWFWKFWYSYMSLYNYKSSLLLLQIFNPLLLWIIWHPCGWNVIQLMMYLSRSIYYLLLKVTTGK